MGRMFELIVAAKVEVGSLFPDVFGIDQDAPRELMFDAEGPALFRRSFLFVAQGSDGSKSYIVEQAQGISWGQVQPIGIWIAESEIRRVAFILIRRNEVCSLVKALCPVGTNAGGTGAGLRVVDAEAAACHPLGSELVGEAEARLPIRPVGIDDLPLSGTGKDFAANQRTVAAVGADAGHLKRRRHAGIKPILAIMTLGAGQRNFIT